MSIYDDYWGRSKDYIILRQKHKDLAALKEAKLLCEIFRDGYKVIVIDRKPSPEFPTIRHLWLEDQGLCVHLITTKVRPKDLKAAFSSTWPSVGPQDVYYKCLNEYTKTSWGYWFKTKKHATLFQKTFC